MGKCSLFYVVTLTLVFISMSSCTLISTESRTSLVGFFIFVVHLGLGGSSPPTTTSPLSGVLNSSSILDLSIPEKVNKEDFPYSNQSTFLNTKPGRTGKRRRFNPKRFSETPTKHLKTKLSRQELNSNEKMDAYSLRTKILTQLGAVDPLLCLPKALCGISNKKQKKTSLFNFQPEISPNILMEDSSIDNYIEIMKNLVPSPTPPKKKKTKKAKTSYYDELNPESNYENEMKSSEESTEADGGFSPEDAEYLREKVKIHKWIREDEMNPEPNWWDMMIPTKAYQNVDYKPPTTHKPDDDFFTSYSTASRISRKLKGFFGAFIPVVKWGLGHKSPDVFADDPFFHDFRSFQGRSASNGDQRSFSWFLKNRDDELKLHQDQLNALLRTDMYRKKDIRGRKSRLAKKGSKNKVKKKMNKKRVNKKYFDGVEKKEEEKEKVIDDPVETFQLAVEIGKQMDDPKQCDYVFTGCPFTYLEIIDIIESSRKSLVEEKEIQDSLRQELGSTGSGGEVFDINVQPTLTHELPSGDKFQISLKISDANNEETIIPRIPIRKNKMPPLKPIREPFTESPYFEKTTMPPEVTPFKSSLLENKQIPSNKTIEIIPTPPVSRPITHQSKPIKTIKRSKMKVRPKGVKVRKQWGLQRQDRPKPTTTSPSIIRHSQYHTHTKYKPIPLPTTINKPSHVINYHFHNTNTHPQVSHNSVSPQQLTVHSFPPSPQQPSTQPPPPTTKATTPTLPSPITTPKPKRNLRYSHSRPKKAKKKQRRKKDERIVIRLPESTPNNNYYNLYPTVPLLSNSYQESQPHPPPRNHYNQLHPQSSLSHFNHQMYHQPPSSPHSYPSMEFQSQPYYSPMSPPPPPSGMFPYYLGKRK